MLDSVEEFCYSVERFRKYESYHNHTKYEIKYAVNYVNTILVLYIIL